jgi:hypothetical protein
MKSKNIIISILDENALKAKNLISEDLAVKLGQRLAEEYVRVAKTTFNEADDNLANNYPPFDKVTRGDIIAAGRDEEQDGRPFGVTHVDLHDSDMEEMEELELPEYSDDEEEMDEEEE